MKIYNGIFKGRKIIDNRVNAHATRLIANCIIAYNSTILNTVYQKILCEGASQDVIDEFARISPIACVHILFAGRYRFRKAQGILMWRKWLKLWKYTYGNTFGRRLNSD